MDFCRSEMNSQLHLAPVLAFALAWVGLLSRPNSATAGVQRLTIETHEQAVACGQSGAACAVAPYHLCPTENGPYSAWIATPFSRVASSVHEAFVRKSRMRPMTPGAANGWGVGIYVYPSEQYRGTDAIRNVIIRRGDRTILPITTTIAPVALSDPGGTKKTLAKGFFAFPMDLLDPNSDITIVLIGTGGEVTCPVDGRRLSTLR
jgi:hypothetical protein